MSRPASGARTRVGVYRGEGRRRAPRRRRGRLARGARWAAAVAVLTLLVTGYRLYVSPDTQTVTSATHADVIFALGGDPRVADAAYGLARSGVSRLVVISNGYLPEPANIRELCHALTGPVQVSCFVPEPGTTRGEAEELQRLASANRWHHVIVVAPVFHVSRARYILRRCYAGTMDMVAPPLSYGVDTWLYEFAYQTVGFVKAVGFQDGC